MIPLDLRQNPFFFAETNSAMLITDHILTFRTKREAVKALRQANKRLRSLEPDFYREGVRYFPGWQLLYDASKAEII